MLRLPFPKLLKTLCDFEETLQSIIQNTFTFSESSIIQGLNEACHKDPQGVGIVDIGPRCFKYHFVQIRPKDWPIPFTFEVFNQILTLQNEDARSFYNINYLTNSTFYLSQSDKKSRKLRHLTTTYFSPKKFYEDSCQTLPHLLDQLKNVSSYFNAEDIVNEYILNVISRTLNGFEISKDLLKVLRDLKNPYIWFPNWVQFLIPDFRKRKAAFDFKIKAFLTQQIEQMHVNPSKPLNLFQKLITSNLPLGHTLKKFSKSEINKLITNPDIRLAITGLFAVKNIQTAIKNGLRYLYDHRIAPDLLKELNGNLARGYDVSNDTTFDKNDFPILHAFFLETLRLDPPMPLLFRYTNKKLVFERFTIPKRSWITLDLGEVLTRLFGSHQYPAYSFHFERFLNEQGQLNELAILHKNMFEPFGLGRRCPAENLSSFLFKKIILHFVQHIKSYSLNLTPPLQFYTAEELKFFSFLGEFRELKESHTTVEEKTESRSPKLSHQPHTLFSLKKVIGQEKKPVYKPQDSKEAFIRARL